MIRCALSLTLLYAAAMAPLPPWAMLAALGCTFALASSAMQAAK